MKIIVSIYKLKISKIYRKPKDQYKTKVLKRLKLKDTLWSNF